MTNQRLGDGRRSFLIGLIGQGVTPSLSPAMHEREGMRHGLQYVYRTVDITPEQASPDSIRRLLEGAHRFGFDGLNITHPIKQAIIPLLDELAPTADRVGAVNTVVLDGPRTIGHNTDVTGFGASFDATFGPGPFGRVVLLGAGGAGAALACALAERQVAEVAIVDLERKRADELARLAGAGSTASVRSYPSEDLPQLLASAGGVVNASPVGMAAHPGVPLDVSLLRADTWVADIIYRPTETALLRAARERGCRTMSGLGMAMGQAADAFEIFTGEPVDRTAMLADLQDLVAAEAAGGRTRR